MYERYISLTLEYTLRCNRMSVIGARWRSYLIYRVYSVYTIRMNEWKQTPFAVYNARLYCIYCAHYTPSYAQTDVKCRDMTHCAHLGLTNN